MRGFKPILVSSKHKIKGFLTQEKYFQTTNAVDTLPLTLLVAGGGGLFLSTPRVFLKYLPNGLS